ncbi:hypothetical protein CNMCM8686_008312 [Aspergillus fumigatus]|nr:hypothetical protein CNMCM8686_008312 [Aspergillus fumigatus]
MPSRRASVAAWYQAWARAVRPQALPAVRRASPYRAARWRTSDSWIFHAAAGPRPRGPRAPGAAPAAGAGGHARAGGSGGSIDRTVRAYSG